MYEHAPSSIFCNNAKLEIAQCLSIELLLIDKQFPVYSYKVILLSNKNGVTTDTHNNMDVSQKRYAKWKGTDIN